jgi:hypothetical protein
LFFSIATLSLLTLIFFGSFSSSEISLISRLLDPETGALTCSLKLDDSSSSDISKFPGLATSALDSSLSEKSSSMISS